MVRTKTLKGEHSFRGLGFIKVNGLNIPVCGSRRVNFSVGTDVTFDDTFLAQVSPEQEMRATFEIEIIKNSADAFAQWRVNQGVNAVNFVRADEILDSQLSLDANGLLPLFRWRSYATWFQFSATNPFSIRINEMTMHDPANFAPTILWPQRDTAVLYSQNATASDSFAFTASVFAET